jgi:hypothetical protein
VTDEALIRTYYAHFNARRRDDAAALLASQARLEHPNLSLAHDGRDAYGIFADRWLCAFPDSVLTIERIDVIRERCYEVHLVGEGTHDGDFDMGALGVFKATHQKGRIRFRHLLEIHDGRITSSVLTFDTQAMIQQLAGGRPPAT